MLKRWWWSAWLCVAGCAAAQQDAAQRGLAEYRAMLAESNPAELYEAKGETLWSSPRGPLNATLERCDLGKGPGVVDGAFVELPRWFADTGQVQDLESRLLTCMQRWQGFDAVQIAATAFGHGEQLTLEALVAWIAGRSRTLAFRVPQAHVEERTAYELGKRAFYYRAGPYDFSCASCHAQGGRRIRLQELPNLTGNPGDGIGIAAWPAYRISTGELWSLQRRFPYPGYASPVTIALGVYLGVNAQGARSAAPALRR